MPRLIDVAEAAERDRRNHVVHATGRTHNHCGACNLPITDDLWILRYPTPHEGAAFHERCYRFFEDGCGAPPHPCQKEVLPS